MKSITAIKLSNGTIVENEAEAIAKQKEIDFNNAIFEFAEQYGYSSETKQAIRETIIDNKIELSKIIAK